MNAGTVARRLRMGADTIGAFLAPGALAGSFDGHQWEISETQLDEFVESCRIEPGSLSPPLTGKYT